MLFLFLIFREEIMEKLFLYDMDRVLLIFLLLADLERDNITYVTYEGKESILEGLPGRKIILENSKMYGKNQILNRIKMSKYIKELRKELAPVLKRIENGEAKLYGMDNLALGKRVFYKERINVIEEGTLNYMPYKADPSSIKELVQKGIALLFGLSERKKVMGYGDSVDKIYLTDSLCERVPEGLEKKAEIINLQELWERKSEQEKRVIKRAFNFNEEILEKISGESVMLFTQPMSEDGILSEERKIELYTKVIERYPNKSVIIKAHPREKTDYSKHFPNCYVMREKYPVELLSVMGIKLERVVTLFSTAVFGFDKDIAIDFYGTEVDNKLFERFGSCDNIMVRNSYL